MPRSKRKLQRRGKLCYCLHVWIATTRTKTGNADIDGSEKDMNEGKRQLIQKIYLALQAGENTKGDMLLPERDLDEHFHVKRSYLREALIALEALGVIDIRERQGMFVGGEGTNSILDSLNLLTAWPVDSIAQIFELRVMIESPTAAFAALRRTDRDMEQIRGALDYLENLWRTRHPDIGVLGARYNAILHSFIVKAAHNAVLLRVYEGLSKLYTDTIASVGNQGREKLPYEKWPDTVLSEHRDLVEAIERQNPEAARAASIRHLEKSRDRIQTLISPNKKNTG